MLAQRKKKHDKMQSQNGIRIPTYMACGFGCKPKNYHMLKTDARTVRSSGSLSIANDSSEPQFGRVKVPITLLFVDETIKCVVVVFFIFLIGTS